MIYKDKSYSIKERVDNLLSLMTLDEKISQLNSILPHMIVEATSGKIKQDELEKFGKNGIGRIAQFTICSMLDIENVGKIHNAIQEYLINQTRLGIPFLAQVETLNGLLAVDATSFPTPLSLASSFNPALALKMGQVISKEMKAVGARYALSPVVDLAKDPRWGRCYETFGEDKYHSSVMGINVVKGLQGNDVKDNVVSCAKHFLGYSASQAGLNTSEVHIGKKELYEEYATPFEAAINKANLQGIMCSYSAIDGEVVSFSKDILTNLLRDKMGFTGTCVCDGGSIERGYTHQGLFGSMKKAGARAIRAGLCSDAPVANAYHYLKEAVAEGLVTEEEIDKQVRYVLKQKFELGLFDNPYVDVEKIKEIYSDNTGKELSKKIADESVILLKNENNLLPLSEKTEKIAVIGPHANKLAYQFAGYSYIGAIDMFLSLQLGKGATMQGVAENLVDDEDDPFQAAYKKQKIGLLMKMVLKLAEEGVDILGFIAKWKYKNRNLYTSLKEKSAKKVKYEKGCDIQKGKKEKIEKAVKLAKESDVVIMTLGGKCGWSQDAMSGEGKDRSSLELPEIQKELLKEVYKANKNIVAVIYNGRPMSINFAKENVPAILESWFGGPCAGEAIADIILGNVNPSGKLPITIPRSEGQIPINYNHKCGSGYNNLKTMGLEALFGGGYTDIESKPLYSFGHGLSYTTFELSDYKCDKDRVKAGDKIKASINVKNTGKVRGAETVMLFAKLRNLDVTTPFRQLVGYQKVELDQGKKATVEFELDTKILGCFDMDNEFSVRECLMELEIGTASDNIYDEKSIEIFDKLVINKDNREYITKTAFKRE